jgi:hypothetical protein
MTTRTTFASTVVFATLVAPGLALAEGESGGAQVSAPVEAPAGAVALPSLGARLESLEKQLTDLKEENKSLATQVSELQESQSQASEPASELGKTKIFGFTDMTFLKTYYSRSDSVYRAVLPMPTQSTFISTGMNVFFANQLTERLKFLSEVRFTYLPLGAETGTQAYVVLPNGNTMNLGSKYSRTDTTVSDPMAQSYRLGGISLERLQATYVLNDYLGVTAGHFLTPYGIWNVDHGSPVILMFHAPIFQSVALMPTQQLGLQVFGKVFVAKNLSLDYAGTLTNGRGPADSVVDFDNDKALGLRWHLNYEIDDFSISLGQYGYTGQYTDISKAIYTGPGTADISSATTVMQQYRERILASDVLIKFFGIRLQGELVFNEVKYDVPTSISPSNFNGNPALASQYSSANYNSWGYYGLLAYELPEQLTTRKIRVTPYVYFERFVLNDTIINSGRNRTYCAGINIKPYPRVVLKLEYDRFRGDDMVNTAPDGSTKTANSGVGQILATQVALTF